MDGEASDPLMCNTIRQNRVLRRTPRLRKVVVMVAQMEKATAAQYEKLCDFFTEIVSGSLTLRLLEEMGPEVTVSQLECLRFVSRHASCSVSDVASGLRISSAAATKLIDRLVRKALVDRRENPEDRRLVELNLTAEGVKLFAAVRKERLARLSAILDIMGLQQRAAFVRGIEAFVEAGLSQVADIDEICRRCGIEHEAGCIINQAHLATTGKPVERL